MENWYNAPQILIITNLQKYMVGDFKAYSCDRSIAKLSYTEKDYL